MRAASNDDAAIRATLVDVIHMLQPPTALFGLSLIARTAVHALGQLAFGWAGTAAPLPALPAAQPGA